MVLASYIFWMLFAESICARFKMKDLGRTIKALGMDFSQDLDGRFLKLCLKSYLVGVGERFSISPVECLETPLTKAIVTQCEQAKPGWMSIVYRD